MSIAMLESAKSFIGCTTWPYALCHAALIKNIIPHSALPTDVSLFELWTGNKPSVSIICTFGCKATLAIPKKQHNKLSNCSTSSFHLGLAIGNNDVERIDGGNGMGEDIQVDERGDNVVMSGEIPVEPWQSGQQHQA